MGELLFPKAVIKEHSAVNPEQVNCFTLSGNHNVLIHELPSQATEVFRPKKRSPGAVNAAYRDLATALFTGE